MSETTKTTTKKKPAGYYVQRETILGYINETAKETGKSTLETISQYQAAAAARHAEWVIEILADIKGEVLEQRFDWIHPDKVLEHIKTAAAANGAKVEIEEKDGWFRVFATVSGGMIVWDTGWDISRGSAVETALEMLVASESGPV